jgi:hypothetical protein
LEALTYEMPFGLVFRKAVLWHDAQPYVFRNLKETGDRGGMQWNFCCATRDRLLLRAEIDGRGPSVHRLPYIKTDCTGTFEVANNSHASATILLEGAGRQIEWFETKGGAVLELVG